MYVSSYPCTFPHLRIHRFFFNPFQMNADILDLFFLVQPCYVLFVRNLVFWDLSNQCALVKCWPGSSVGDLGSIIQMVKSCWMCWARLALHWKNLFLGLSQNGNTTKGLQNRAGWQFSIIRSVTMWDIQLNQSSSHKNLLILGLVTSLGLPLGIGNFKLPIQSSHTSKCGQRIRIWDFADLQALCFFPIPIETKGELAPQLIDGSDRWKCESLRWKFLAVQVFFLPSLEKNTHFLNSSIQNAHQVHKVHYILSVLMSFSNIKGNSRFCAGSSSSSHLWLLLSSSTV